MSQKVELNKESTAILLFNNAKDKWEDKTFSITAVYTAFYHGKFTGYNIYFKGADKYFFYKEENLQLLKKEKSVDIEKQDVYADDKLVTASGLDQFENGYFRVYSGNSTLFTDNIKLKSNKYKDIFTYYSSLAEYAGSIAEKDSPLFYLAQNYKRIPSPSNDTVLMDYLHGECKPVIDVEQVVLPFDFNQSQVEAINTALNNNISIIEGPPGTGKTQTILNLIANIIYRGKNCAVISNNNTAIKNVYEKLTEEKLAFIAAALGRQNNVVQFFESEQNEEISWFLEKQLQPIKSKDTARIAELNAQMKTIQATEVETSKLESELIDIQNEKRHHDESYNEALIINQKLHPKDYLALITRLENPKKFRFFERWYLRIKYRVKILQRDLNVLLTNAEKLYYQSKFNELTGRIESNKKYLKKHNTEEVGNELKSLYHSLLENYIMDHYRKHGLKKFSKDSYKADFKNFLLRYPVVLSTSQSLLNNAPKDFKFDYLIIDEASQGDILSSLLAINCAKNLVVIGDSRQLQQIEEERLFLQSEKLAEEFNVPEPYRYESNSILKSVKDAVTGAPTTLLREHYRCAPDIINFCSKMFYNAELVAMTENSGKHIEIIKTVPGNHARKNPNGSGLYNQREIDEIENILQESDSDSIGIISPFRHQSNLITDRFASDRIEADTIHKFQGRQKEEVILSFVVNSLDKNENNIENRLYDFVTNTELLNVAISRARNKVTVIIADKVYHSSNNTINDFIKYAEYIYGTDATRESAVTSVFDLLYSEYTSILLTKYKKSPNKHKTELLMCDIISLVLKDHSYIRYLMHSRLALIVKVPETFSDEERKYILHPWTHVDFLFYNKVSKETLFVLEVDGIRYHEQNKNQLKNDEIKNRVLQSNNIPIFRFKTNESNEMQRLSEIIKEFSH